MRPAVSAILIAAACSFPGVRPEGRVHATSAYAPAPRDSVFNRADQWMRAQGYTITSVRAGSRVVGYRLMSTEGSTETRSELSFEITSATAAETRFTVQARTLRGTPPIMSEFDAQGSPAFTDANTLISRLMCPGARWPTCP